MELHSKYLRKTRTTELKILKKILLVIGILAIIVFVIIWDIADRGQFYSKHIPIEEHKVFQWKYSVDYREKIHSEAL